MPRLRSLGLFGLIGVPALAGAANLGLAQDLIDPKPTGALRSGFEYVPPPAPDKFIVPERRQRQASRARTQRYGNPPGSGAGKTGFVSTNTKLPPRPPAAGPLDLTPDGFGSSDTSPSPSRPAAPPALPPPAAGGLETPRPGASTIPGAALPGQNYPPSPPEEDPFVPTGFPVGSFIVRPAIELSGGYDSNPSRVTTGSGSWFGIVAPELLARSDWARHELSANLRGTYTTYEAVPSLNRPSVDARVNGRIDITRDTRADLEARYLVATDNPGSPDLPAGLARLPINTTVGGTAGVTQRFNRFEVGIKGTVDRVSYHESELTNGVSVSNRDRDYHQYGVQSRVAYELTPGIKPFAEGTFDQRNHDLPVDRYGQHRDSEGLTGRLGTTFELSRKLTGEVSAGYLTRTYKDPNLPDLSGLIADGSLVWSATALTTVKLTAQSSANESTLPGVAGVLRRDAGVQVDHAFRRWLIGTARLGYGVDLYRGSPREDSRYLASVALIYRMGRNIQLKGELRREWMRSNVAGVDYDATIALLGMRLQR